MHLLLQQAWKTEVFHRHATSSFSDFSADLYKLLAPVIDQFHEQRQQLERINTATKAVMSCPRCGGNAFRHHVGNDLELMRGLAKRHLEVEVTTCDCILQLLAILAETEVAPMPA